MIQLEDQAARHVHQVLRLGDGAPLVLFDGNGGEFEAMVRQASRKGVTVELGAHHGREAESPLRIHLGQGLSRGERMDYAVQKSVELGVHRLTPLETDRCGVKLPPDRLAKRESHWRRIATAACEQCGRNRVPEVGPVMKFAPWLDSLEADSPKLMLVPEAGARLVEMTPPAGTVALLIGPEGGLSEAEVAAARAAGFTGVRLGPRTLRTETAAVAALAALQALWGDG